MTHVSSAFDLVGAHPADRVMAAQALSSDLTLRGEKPPTRRQVAAVMHALADYTHQLHMLGPAVFELAQDTPERGELQLRATALGRYFHALGDHLER